jgi:hypothetical protein
LTTGEQRWQCGCPDPRVNLLPQKLADKDVDFLCGVFVALEFAASSIIWGHAVLVMKHARNDITQPIEGAAGRPDDCAEPTSLPETVVDSAAGHQTPRLSGTDPTTRILGDYRSHTATKLLLGRLASCCAG